MKKLNKADIQYQIVHDFASLFKIGQKVFLRSNPKLVLTVINIIDDLVEASWEKENKTYKNYFPPQSLLQYNYAGLIYWNNNEMCLN